MGVRMKQENVTNTWFGDRMKKKIYLATALLATTSLAHAQSSVTLFGTVGGGVRWMNGTKGGSTVAYDNSIVANNNFGISGTEDLGGGIKAIFQLQSPYFTSNGNFAKVVGGTPVMFANAAWVGVDGNYGRLTFGRQFNAFEDTALALDPTNGRGQSIYNVPLVLIDTSPFSGFDSRFNNTVKYRNKFRGLTLDASYSFGGVAGNTRAGSNYAASALYQFGTLLGGASYQRSYSADASQWAQNVQAGAAWQVGPVRIYGNYTTFTVTGTAGAPERRDKVPDGGIVYQVTPSFQLTAAFYDDIASNLGNVPNANGHKVTYYAIAEYYLSKRTELYAQVDRNGLSGAYKTDPTNIAALGMARGGSGVTGVSVGLMTQF
jgi:outer membrane protein OmpU